MSTSFVSPGTTVDVPAIPNQKDPLLAPDLTVSKPPIGGYVPQMSIAYYTFFDKLRRVLLSLKAEFPALITNENGGNNAIACPASSGPTLAAGVDIMIKLAHTLQAGANTFAYNGGTAVAIKSHRNPASDIAAGYAAGSILNVVYDGTVWQDLSQ